MSDNTEIRFLAPARVRFWMAGAVLRATLEGEQSLLQAAVVRAFPLTKPDSWFSVRDGAGKEAGILPTLEGLDAESLVCVRAELKRRYVTARLTAVRKVKERFGIVEWETDTDKGPCRFSTRDLRENVLRLSSGHFVLIDVEGNRYDIPDMAALDPDSQARLQRHL